MKKKIFLTLLFLMIFYMSKGDVTNVIFFNSGKMFVGTSTHSSKVALFITDAYRDVGTMSYLPKIELTGYMEIGGNFYHDAWTNSFVIDANGYNNSKSSGNFIFSGNTGQLRYITTTTDPTTCYGFNRWQHYAAFPNIILNSNDSLIIPARMGIDATSFHLGAGKVGSMVLRSDKLYGYDYDASLRITGSGTSSSLVDLGSVVVEREMSLYRYGDGSNPSIFPFATPFKDTQLSGYFAGNWVRRPLADGANGSTTYVYGNKDNTPADGIIDMDQYVYMASEKLVPSQPYLIKPRPAGYDYSNLKNSNGLWFTGEPVTSLYDKAKLYFNGKVYTVTPYKEQLFADDNLKTLSASGTPATTVNWLIGNSYTCPISTVELAKAMENAAGLIFSPVIYVYTAGSQSYQPMNVSGSGNSITVSNYSEIPAMSVFMLRLSKVAQNGSITLGKSLLKHDINSHGTPNAVKSLTGVSKSSVTNQINFKVYPSDNNHVYDLAAIGLRENAAAATDEYDQIKVYNPDENCFQLYTLSTAGNKLAGNGMPLNADTVRMDFKPGSNENNYTIEATNVNTLTSEGVWLYDKIAKKLTDLRTQPLYTFKSNKNDNVNRFRVYFKSPKTPIDVINNHTNTPDIEAVFNGNTLMIKNLTENDVNSLLSVYDVQGRMLNSLQINTYPVCELKGNFISGIYLIHVKGKRNSTIKAIKNK